MSAIRLAVIIVLVILLFYCLHKCAKYAPQAALTTDNILLTNAHWVPNEIPTNPVVTWTTDWQTRWQNNWQANWRERWRMFANRAFRNILMLRVINLRLRDSQNVHDSGVVKTVHKKYKHLVELQGPIDTTIIDDLYAIARVDILEHTPEDQKQTITNVLDYIKNSGATISSLSDDPDDPESELIVMIRVWMRITSPDTVEQSKDMWEIFIHQFIDMVDRDHMQPPVDPADDQANPDQTNPADDQEQPEQPIQYVCVTGRVMRMLNTLTIIDPDKTLAEPELSLSQMSAAMLNRAQAVVKDELAANPEMQKQYDEADELPADISQHLKNKIKMVLTTEYSELIDQAALDKTINEAQQAIY